MSSSMISHILLLFFASACSGFFFQQSSSDNQAYNVCIYSRDTSQYEPSCFVCPAIVYPTALMACVNGTSMPNNITYSSANCMQGNCKINYPTSAPPQPYDYEPFFKNLAKLLQVTKRSIKRSIRDNFLWKPKKQTLAQTGPPKSKWDIIDEVETYASDLVEVDYVDDF